MHINKSLYFRILKSLSILGLILTPAYTSAEQKLYWTNSSYDAPAIHCVDSQGHSCLDKANPTNTVLLNLTPSFDYPTGIVIDEKNSKVIFANGSTIETCNLDGTGRNSTFITDQSSATHLGIDPLGEKIYWTSFNGIKSANLDGTGIADGPITSINSFSGLTVDATSSSLIWFEGQLNGTKLLQTADLTLLTPITLSSITGNDNLFGIAANETTSNTYFIQFDIGSFTFADLKTYSGYISGGSLTNHLSGLSATNTSELLSYNGIAIDYPESNIYYGNGSTNKIFRTSLTQSAASQTTFVANAGEVKGLAFTCGKHAPDSDGDKTADCRDDCSSDPNKTKPGLCGCNSSDLDTDLDGTPDCLDECTEDENKTSPGLCGCGKEEPGVCGCGLVEDINSDGKVVCVKSRQLAPNTKIEEPPEVEVDDEKNSVTYKLEKFTKPTLTLKKKKKKANASATAFDYYDYSIEATSKGLKIKYEIQVSKEGEKKKDIQKFNSKKNEYTQKNVAPGNYTVKYRPVIVDSNGKDVSKIQFSPAANFTVN